MVGWLNGIGVYLVSTCIYFLCGLDVVCIW